MGPRQRELVRAGDLDEKVLPPGRRHDLDADVQPGGVVVVDRDGDRGLAGDVEHRREHGHRIAVHERHHRIVLDALTPRPDAGRKASHGPPTFQIEVKAEMSSSAGGTNRGTPTGWWPAESRDRK